MSKLIELYAQTIIQTTRLLLQQHKFIQQTNQYGTSMHKSVCAERSTKKVCDIACKTALIIGGAEGIGKAIAFEVLALKARNIAIVGLNNCRGKEAVTNLNCAFGKNKVVFFNCDIECRKDVEKLFRNVLKEFDNRLDIIINTAGIFNGCAWEREIQTNLLGTMFTCTEAYNLLTKTNAGKGGTILNVTGVHGALRPLHAAPTLAASFGGVLAYSRSMGEELNFLKSGIRVLTLCTGFTNTDFMKDIEKRTQNEQALVQLESVLCKEERQQADVCGKAGAHLLEYGPNGSVWVIEGSKLYSLNMPDWTTYRTLESQMV